MSESVYGISDNFGNPQLISIECHITSGLPSIIIVGFANKAVDEAKERLRASFSSAKLQFPRKRLTINLAPADLPKDGSGYDLGMAVVIMAEAKLVQSQNNSYVYIGELGLNGIIRPVRGIIGKLMAGKKKGKNIFVIPRGNLIQAKLIPDITIFPVGSLDELYKHLAGLEKIKPISTGKGSLKQNEIKQNEIDFSDISGQQRAKRALEIAAAGNHNILLNGPPGTGKSMLAKAFSAILPPMDILEVLEVTQIHSLSSTEYDKVITDRPFRSPHHSASEIAIVGGGQNAKPGEISLAHKGVLFLDEFPEYNRSTIETLRQPLEDKYITIARAKNHAIYPADFILVATSNPCPCGYYGTSKDCSCLPHAILQYQRKLSGPIIDRIDLYVDVDNVDHTKLLENNSGVESSSTVQQRVVSARNKQLGRNGNQKTNSQLSSREVKSLTKLNKEAEEFLNVAASQLEISARAYMRIIKIARTIADLENADSISKVHISEAVQYRKPKISL